MSTRIQDPRLQELYETGSSSALPATIYRRGHRIARLLLAAQCLEDIIWPIAEIEEELYAISIEGKWVVTFAWNPGVGAVQLALQRV